MSSNFLKHAMCTRRKMREGENQPQFSWWAQRRSSGTQEIRCSSNLQLVIMLNESWNPKEIQFLSDLQCVKDRPLPKSRIILCKTSHLWHSCQNLQPWDWYSESTYAWRSNHWKMTNMGYFQSKLFIAHSCEIFQMLNTPWQIANVKICLILKIKDFFHHIVDYHSNR